MDRLTTSASALDYVPGVVAHAGLPFAQRHFYFLAFLCSELVNLQYIFAGQILFLATCAILRTGIIPFNDGRVALFLSTL